ncbi:hypothetical protein [Aureimonas phyllosphaerae]|uniref:Hydroxyquinol 1,2-dioxygenase n=1 Tax=Aureimonas phyllosphaerae TaxID=1166078 RepID=A0A7W6BNW4_9HYPH|nr:hypothetical protein [Aureimonas phyllosphaerae]MBB3934207.1 hypothetical protein [Aureimonas phyllosphaerae]MBB3958577.1 hypothetical protein [Aureimonas phyllosphaerae]SFE99132.1 hypothetical protein SAMN05216566_101551 [Aureimonas phyllosphaerae]
MSRILFSATAALLLSAGFASAADLVPGSDLGVRQAQAAADHSVVTGTVKSRDRSETSYGYQSGRTVRSESFVPAERPEVRENARSQSFARGGAIVPGSDSF